jgi:hypothetical protein
VDTTRCIAAPLAVALALIVLVAPLPATRGDAETAPPPQTVFESRGNRLTVRPTAPVVFTTTEAMITGIEASLPASASSVRLLQQQPRELVEYVFAVIEGGRLLVGRQYRAFDDATRGYQFERGEMWRSFSPLDDRGEWTWLVEIPVSREKSVTLEVHADGARWPVERVSIGAGHAR